MAKYSVHIFCDACGNTHPMGVAVKLADGPADRASLGDAYAGRDLPPEIMTMLGNMTRCPATGRLIQQRDNSQVFLVPIG